MKIYVIKRKRKDTWGNLLLTAQEIGWVSRMTIALFFFRKKDAQAYLDEVFSQDKITKEDYEVVPFERVKK